MTDYQFLDKINILYNIKPFLCAGLIMCKYVPVNTGLAHTSQCEQDISITNHATIWDLT